MIFFSLIVVVVIIQLGEQYTGKFYFTMKETYEKEYNAHKRDKANYSASANK